MFFLVPSRLDQSQTHYVVLFWMNFQPSFMYNYGSKNKKCHAITFTGCLFYPCTGFFNSFCIGTHNNPQCCLNDIVTCIMTLSYKWDYLSMQANLSHNLHPDHRASILSFSLSTPSPPWSFCRCLCS